MDNNIELDFKAKVLHQINYARTHPQKFAKTIRSIIPYFKGKILKYPDINPIMTTEGPKAFEEVARYLDNLEPLAPLTLDTNMTNIAKDSLSDILALSDFEAMDALNIDDYIDKYGIVVGSFSQSLDFGSPLPELVVTNLIVDDGDIERANRKNILSNRFKIAGIAHGKHDEFGSTSVLVYCQSFYSKNEEKYKEIKSSMEEERKKSVLNIVRRLSYAKEHRDSINDIIKAMKTIDDLEGKYKDIHDKTIKSKKIVQNSDDDEDDYDKMEEGVVSLSQSEKIIQDGNKKVKIITITKTMEDGSIVKEKRKEFL